MYSLISKCKFNLTFTAGITIPDVASPPVKYQIHECICTLNAFLHFNFIREEFVSNSSVIVRPAEWKFIAGITTFALREITRQPGILIVHLFANSRRPLPFYNALLVRYLPMVSSISRLTYRSRSTTRSIRNNTNKFINDRQYVTVFGTKMIDLLMRIQIYLTFIVNCVN